MHDNMFRLIKDQQKREEEIEHERVRREERVQCEKEIAEEEKKKGNKRE